MPYIRVWIHFVWSTKNRQPILTDEFRYPLFDHIRRNALLKNILTDIEKIAPNRIYLHAQVQVIPFYEKAGFDCTGPEFIEADIRHRKMILKPKE